jgi:nucleotide-binding universal stress UspA family protein
MTLDVRNAMKRILAALDSSEIADLVVAEAAEQARARGGKLRLLTVVAGSPPPPPGLLLTYDAGASLLSARDDLLQRLEQVPEELRDGVVVELGSPTDGILRAAEEYDPDLLVIGAHAHGAIARALGTTAARVVNRVDRPVLVVRPRPAAREVLD